MGRIAIEGGELGTIVGPDWQLLGVDLVSAGKPASFSGTYYFQFENANDRLIYSFPVADTEVYGSWAHYDTAIGTWVSIVQFKDSGGTIIATIIMQDVGVNRVIRVIRGANAGTVLASSGEFAKLVECHFEFRYVPLNSGGTFQVKKDGVLIIDYSGDTTAGLENIKELCFGTFENYSTGFYGDDFVLDDANWIGHTRIQKLQISGAGTVGDWDASAGSPYQCVDEIPPVDSDYISTNVANESATFACADLTGSIASIKCLQVYARMAYEGAPTPTKQKIAARVNGTEYYGSDVSPTTGFLTQGKLWELNPDDSAAWETADINAIEIGVRSVA